MVFLVVENHFHCSVTHQKTNLYAVILHEMKTSQADFPSKIYSTREISRLGKYLCLRSWKRRFSLLFSCTNFNQIHRMVNWMHTRSHKVRIHPLKNSLCGNFVISFLLNHNGTFQINLPFMVQCLFSLSKMTLASGQMGASKTFPWPKAVSGLSVENSWLHFVFEWVLTFGRNYSLDNNWIVLTVQLPNGQRNSFPQNLQYSNLFSKGNINGFLAHLVLLLLKRKKRVLLADGL